MSDKLILRIETPSGAQIGMRRAWHVVCGMVKAGAVARVVVEDGDTRTKAQNDKMWAMLTDVAKQVDWYGQKLSADDWKQIFSAEVQEQRAVPRINGGGFVILGVPTRKQSKKWFSDMFELINAFAAERGVVFGDDDEVGE